MILCAIVSQEGRLSRYESSGARVRLTHQYQHEYNGKPVPATFTADVVEDMRLRPPEHLRIAVPEEFTPSPTPPNAIAARAA